MNTTRPGNGEYTEAQEEMLPAAVQAEIVSPAVMMRQATDVAGVSAEIVKKTAVTISGRKHVRVEGWQAIAIAHGCMLSARDVNRIEGGVRAMGEVRRMSDGALLATAEGFVGDDEKTWAGRAEYAKRAMAQTRAMSRAARSAFAHVVVMIDSEMSTTPAEEIPEEEHKPAKPKGNLVNLKIHVDKCRNHDELGKLRDMIEARSWTEDEVRIIEKIMFERSIAIVEART